MRDTDTEAEKKKGSSGAAPPPCPYQEIVDLYHECLPAHPRVLALNDKRKAMVRGRWGFLWEGRKQRGLPHESADLLSRLRLFFGEEVKGSKFLTGRAPPQRDRAPFIADFEWLMNATNFLKVMERKYADEVAA